MEGVRRIIDGARTIVNVMLVASVVMDSPRLSLGLSTDGTRAKVGPMHGSGSIEVTLENSEALATEGTGVIVWWYLRSVD